MCVFIIFRNVQKLQKLQNLQKLQKLKTFGGDDFKNAFKKNKFLENKKIYNSEKYFLKILKSKVSPPKVLNF